MTASIVDTAELPRTRSWPALDAVAAVPAAPPVVAAPVVAPEAPAPVVETATPVAAPVPDRGARVVRRQARRQRQLTALLGVALLALALAATVAVLGVVR